MTEIIKNEGNIKKCEKYAELTNLRDVIKNWCQDFGLDFYWSDNAIYFYDTKTGTSINDGAVDSTTLLSRKTSFSIEGNYSQGNIV